MAATLQVPVTEEDHIQGNKNAQITLVEYGDYQCPGCGFAYPIIKRVQKHFGSKLRFVFRNFPLTEIHQFAEASAETAEFAAKFDRFWDMHDLIYANQTALSDQLLLELAETLSLPLTELNNALQYGTYRSKIKEDFMGGVRSGVNGTPSFYINGIKHEGPFEFEDLVNAIQAALNG